MQPISPARHVEITGHIMRSQDGYQLWNALQCPHPVINLPLVVTILCISCAHSKITQVLAHDIHIQSTQPGGTTTGAGRAVATWRVAAYWALHSCTTRAIDLRCTEASQKIPSLGQRCCSCWRGRRPGRAHRAGTPSDHPPRPQCSCRPSTTYYISKARDPNGSHLSHSLCAKGTIPYLRFEESGRSNGRNYHVTRLWHQGS